MKVISRSFIHNNMHNFPKESLAKFFEINIKKQHFYKKFTLKISCTSTLKSGLKILLALVIYNIFNSYYYKSFFFVNIYIYMCVCIFSEIFYVLKNYSIFVKPSLFISKNLLLTPWRKCYFVYISIQNLRSWKIKIKYFFREFM